MNLRIFISFLLIASFFVGCVEYGDDYSFYRLPTDISEIPSDPMNEITPLKAAIGRAVFHAKEISQSSTVSCASCHVESDVFQTPDLNIIGGAGEGFAQKPDGTYYPIKEYTGKKDSMTWVTSRGGTNIAYANLAGASGRFGGSQDLEWRNARITHFGIEHLEAEYLDKLFQCDPSLFQANIAFSGHRQFSYERLRDFLNTRPSLEDSLEVAFNVPITKTTSKEDLVFMLSCSIDAYQRTQLSVNSRFQQYLRGEAGLTQSELSGLQLVINKCTYCHDNKVFGGTQIQPSHLPNWLGVPDAVNDIRSVPDDTYIWRVVPPMLKRNAYGTHSEYRKEEPYIKDHSDFVFDYLNNEVVYYQVFPLDTLSEKEVNEVSDFLRTL